MEKLRPNESYNIKSVARGLQAIIHDLPNKRGYFASKVPTPITLELSDRKRIQVGLNYKAQPYSIDDSYPSICAYLTVHYPDIIAEMKWFIAPLELGTTKEYTSIQNDIDVYPPFESNRVGTSLFMTQEAVIHHLMRQFKGSLPLPVIATVLDGSYGHERSRTKWTSAMVERIPGYVLKGTDAGKPMYQKVYQSTVK